MLCVLQSKDVVSQAQAVSSLASLDTSDGVVHVLMNAVRNSRLFCRVRADAALAVGATASEITQLRGAGELLAYFR